MRLRTRNRIAVMADFWPQGPRCQQWHLVVITAGMRGSAAQTRPEMRRASFFPSSVLSVSLSLGTPEGQSPQARNVSLRHADCVFSQDRIGIRHYGGAGFTMARWCQGWQINVYININGEYLRLHQHRSKGTALFYAEMKLIWSESRNTLQQLLEYNSIVKWNITACWRLYTNAQRSIID